MRLESNRAKIALTLVIALILISAFLGVFHSAGSTTMTGQPGTCPFMPGVVICNMTPMQHIAAAQSLFNALPFHTDFASLLLALLAALIGFLPFLRRTFALQLETVRHVLATTLVHTSPRFALQEAYSRGILNSKLF